MEFWRSSKDDFSLEKKGSFIIQSLKKRKRSYVKIGLKRRSKEIESDAWVVMTWGESLSMSIHLNEKKSLLDEYGSCLWFNRFNKFVDIFVNLFSIVDIVFNIILFIWLDCLFINSNKNRNLAFMWYSSRIFSHLFFKINILFE